MADKGNPSKIEELKLTSNFLRGTIAQEMADVSVPSVSEESANLLKTHGTYQQDDRDHRGGEKVFSFMVRTRVPGGTSATVAGFTAASTAAGTLSVPRLSVTGGGSQLRLQWTTQPAAHYQVQRSADLRSWSPVGGTRAASGESDAVDIDAREAGAAFFRVLRLP